MLLGLVPVDRVHLRGEGVDRTEDLGGLLQHHRTRGQRPLGPRVLLQGTGGLHHPGRRRTRHQGEVADQGGGVDRGPLSSQVDHVGLRHDCQGQGVQAGRGGVQVGDGLGQLVGGHRPGRRVTEPVERVEHRAGELVHRVGAFAGRGALGHGSRLPATSDTFSAVRFQVWKPDRSQTSGRDRRPRQGVRKATGPPRNATTSPSRTRPRRDRRGHLSGHLTRVVSTDGSLRFACSTSGGDVSGRRPRPTLHHR